MQIYQCICCFFVRIVIAVIVIAVVFVIAVIVIALGSGVIGLGRRIFPLYEYPRIVAGARALDIERSALAFACKLGIATSILPDGRDHFDICTLPDKLYKVIRG